MDQHLFSTIVTIGCLSTQPLASLAHGTITVDGQTSATPWLFEPLPNNNLSRLFRLKLGAEGVGAAIFELGMLTRQYVDSMFQLEEPGITEFCPSTVGAHNQRCVSFVSLSRSAPSFETCASLRALRRWTPLWHRSQSTSIALSSFILTLKKTKPGPFVTPTRCSCLSTISCCWLSLSFAACAAAAISCRRACISQLSGRGY